LKDKRYAFIDYVDGQEEVIKAVGRWQGVAYWYPTVDEVAADVGMVPEETKRLVYGTKAKTGWFPPTPEMVEEAREKLGEALVCAARMKEGKPSNWAETYSDDPETVREGERFLNEHSEMLSSRKMGCESPHGQLKHQDILERTTSPRIEDEEPSEELTKNIR